MAIALKTNPCTMIESPENDTGMAALGLLIEFIMTIKFRNIEKSNK
jgi:hypothetical protein